MGVLRLFIVVALLLISTALGLGAFFTHAWIRYTVNANVTDPEYTANMGKSFLYHTRERGLFWNMLDPATQTSAVIKANGGSPYFTIVYNPMKACDKPSDPFKKLTTMMKSSAYLHIAYLSCLVFGGWMVAMSAAGNCKSVMGCALGILLIGELAGIASIVLFHFYTIMEETTAVKELDGMIKNSWTKFLKDATKPSYSYSYGAQIASLGISLAALIVSMVFVSKWPEKNKKDEANRQRDPQWLESEQGTAIYDGSVDNRRSDVRQREQNGQQPGNRRHSWSGYWEDEAEKNQNGRFRNTPLAAGHSSSVPGERDSRFPRANMANTKPHYYTNNPLYPARY